MVATFEDFVLPLRAGFWLALTARCKSLRVYAGSLSHFGQTAWNDVCQDGYLRFGTLWKYAYLTIMILC